MKYSKSLLAAVLAMALLSGAPCIQAGEAALVYISPQLYAHDSLLRNQLMVYWISQGELVEPVATESLKQVFGEVAMCGGNRAADVVVTIAPSIFYNPYMSIFYGKIIARAYSGSGKLVGSYLSNVEHYGFLDVLPEAQVRETYRAAMAEVVKQMESDAALKALIAQGVPENETRMPCGMAAILPPTK